MERKYLVNINYTNTNFLYEVYKISDWVSCYDYFQKNIDLLNRKTLERILKYSWLEFNKEWKENIDIIIDLYKLLYPININIEKIIYHAKKKNIKNVYNYINNKII